jgi:hypothetical protein
MIDQALVNLAPGARWELVGDTYEDIIWHDTLQNIPTKDQITAEVRKIVAEYKSVEYQRLRKLEYPPITDYLDAVVKGNQEQIQAYIDACLAVKAKYPKGS